MDVLPLDRKRGSLFPPASSPNAKQSKSSLLTVAPYLAYRHESGTDLPIYFLALKQRSPFPKMLEKRRQYSRYRMHFILKIKAFVSLRCFYFKNIMQSFRVKLFLTSQCASGFHLSLEASVLSLIDAEFKSVRDMN